MPVLGSRPDDAVALEAANELGQQERAAVRPRDQRLQRCRGDVLQREQQPARELGRRVGCQRARAPGAGGRRFARPSSASSAPAPGAPRRKPTAAPAPRASSRTRSRPASRRPRSARRRGSPPAAVLARAARSASPTLRLTVARSTPGAAPSARSSGSSGAIQPSVSAAAGHSVGPELAEQRLAAVRRLFGGHREAAAEQRAQVCVAFTLDRLARAQLDDVASRCARFALLDQRGAQVRLAQPAFGDASSPGPPRRSATRGAQRAEQAIHLLAAAEQRRLRRAYDGQRVVFPRRRQRGRSARRRRRPRRAARAASSAAAAVRNSPSPVMRLELLLQLARTRR